MLRCDEPTMPTLVRTRRPSRLPRPGQWTYADVCRLPDDGKRHEIVDGRHFVSPSPEVAHQRAATRLGVLLAKAVDGRGKGEVLTAPVDVELSVGSILVPDLVVIARGNEGVVKPKRIVGAPDLVVEVLSPSTARRDLDLKRRRYERAGVREYWIVDHEARTVRQFVLQPNGRYAPPVVCTTRVRLAAIASVTIDLTKVFRGRR
jgi:Uma2 family endonuclease